MSTSAHPFAAAFAARLAADVAAIYSGPGSVAVTAGRGAAVRTARGQLDRVSGEGTDTQGFPTVVELLELRVPVGALGDVGRGDPVTVDGVPYTCRFVRREDGDGRVQVLTLREVGT